MPLARIGRSVTDSPWAALRAGRAKAVQPPNTDGANALAAERGRQLAREHIRQYAGLGGRTGVWGNPWGGFLNARTGETAQMRRDYPQMAFSEGVVKAAVQRRLRSVASQTLQVTPADKNSAADKRVAEHFRHELMEMNGRRGIKVAVEQIGAPAVIEGHSLCEMPLNAELTARGRWAGYRGIDRVAAKPQTSYTPQYDEFGKFLGVKTRGGDQESVPAGQLIYYPYLTLYGCPHSELQAAYRAWTFKQSITELRWFYLDKLSGGAVVATGVTDARLVAMKAALDEMRAAGSIAVAPGEEVKALDLAMGANDAFKNACDDCDREMLIAVDGAHLHILEGQTTGGRGNTRVQGGVAELTDWDLAADVGGLLSGAAHIWVDHNYRGADLPRVKIGDIDPNITLAELNVAKLAQDMGAELSKDEVHERSGWGPPRDDADRLTAPAGGGAPFGRQPGDPNAPGAPGAGGDGGQDQWAWEEVPAGDGQRQGV
jgi:hypothetical protein